LLDSRALAFDLLQDLGNALESLGRGSLSAEELAELLSLLVVVRRVPGDVGGLAVEEVWVEIRLVTACADTVATKTGPNALCLAVVCNFKAMMFFFSCTPCWDSVLTRHEHLVLVVLVRVREDISTLECLREESKDVVDDQQCGLSILGAGGVRLHAIDSDPFALLFVALAHDWRNGAASL
jgi:hypothetical protein